MGQHSMPRGEWNKRKKSGTLWEDKKNATKTEVQEYTDIFECIKNKDLHGVKTMLKNDGSLVSATDGEGRTSFLCSVVSGPDEITKFILSKGADVNTALESGATALMIACENANLDLARVFVSKDADVNAKDKEKKTSVLHKAAKGGNADIVKLLLSKGAVADYQCSNGWTPLHVAATEGHFDAAKTLVEKGAANINIKAGDGTTALEMAEKSSSGDFKKIIEFLKSVE